MAAGGAGMSMDVEEMTLPQLPDIVQGAVAAGGSGRKGGGKGRRGRGRKGARS